MKEMKGDLPALRHGDVEKLLKQRVDFDVLKQRVDSNVSLYINGSNTTEKIARSQLWRWYLIFKKLRPDDEVPKNPCRFCFIFLKRSKSYIHSSHSGTTSSRI